MVHGSAPRCRGRGEGGFETHPYDGGLFQVPVRFARAAASRELALTPVLRFQVRRLVFERPDVLHDDAEGAFTLRDDAFGH